MSDGNKRYLGDVYINENNLERQKQLFQSIIESYQYKYGGDFDAATLQGHQASDFAPVADGILARNAIQAPLYIGKTALQNSENHQTIETDGILLENDTDEESSGYKLHHLQWYQSLTNDTLTEALISIYNGAQSLKQELQTEIGTKLDLEEYNTFISDRFTPIETMIDNSSIEYTNNTTRQTKLGLNADLVNGLRPILITRQGYQNLLNSENPDERAQATYWRNIFIFVDELPGDYNAPWEYSLTDPYSFRVHDEHLQVKNNLSEDWVNMATLSDFLAGANFDAVIKEYIENADDFEIGTTSLANSLQLLPATIINENWEDYPFLSSSLHDDFVYAITLNQAQNYLNTTVSNSLKQIDIDVNQILKDNEVLNSNGTKRINNINTELQTQKTNLQNVQSALQGVQRNVSSLQQTNNTQDSTLATIQSQLSSLQNSINTINGNITALTNSVNGKVDRVAGCGWQEYKPTVGGYTDRWGEHGSYLFYNPSSHTAWARIDWTYSYKAANKAKWVKETDAWFYIGPNYCRPVGDVTVAISQNLFVKLRSDGTMHHMAYYAKNKDVDYNIITPVYPTIWW